MTSAKITTLEKTVETLKDENAAMRNRIANLEASMEKLQTNDAPPAKKAKKDHKPHGPTPWNLFAKKIHTDMKAANPDTKFKAPEIAQEAKRRKDEYDVAYWRTILEEMKTASASASETEVTASETDAEIKKKTKVVSSEAESESAVKAKKTKKSNKKD